MTTIIQDRKSSIKTKKPSYTKLLGEYGELLGQLLLGAYKRKGKGAIDLWWPARKATVEVKTAVGNEESGWCFSVSQKQYYNASTLLIWCLDYEFSPIKAYLIPWPFFSRGFTIFKKSKYDKFRIL